MNAFWTLALEIDRRMREALIADYGLPVAAVTRVAGSEGPIPIRTLFPIWRSYYSARLRAGEISWRSPLLHSAYLALRWFRKMRSRLAGR